MRATILVLITSMALGACATSEEPAYSGDPAVGLDVAERLCASCHAIGVDGASPNPGAPPLRSVLAHNDPVLLAKQLDEAVSISHLRMPTFYFGEHHAADLVAYIKTIQRPSPPASP
ncbi:MAG TPA: c-type cytochrome [Hyphomonadaceae bacterium]|jgi:mono/diheme cytochrome c family protein